jgi:hypothetical protein
MPAMVELFFAEELFPVEILDGVQGDHPPGFGGAQVLGQEPDLIANRFIAQPLATTPAPGGDGAACR